MAEERQYVDARLQSSTILWSAFNTGTSTTYTSGTVVIEDFFTKTLALNFTASGTAIIQVQPVSGASWYDYYTDNSVSANTYWYKTFTDQSYATRLAFIVGATAGTLDGWAILQT